jgi:quinol monooxygenase YgiN
MQYGICVRYSYTGDEAKWAGVIAEFTRAVAADKALAGKFSYHVQKTGNGGRIHIGRWDAPGTVKAMQAQPYFAAFAAALKDLAGDTLVAEPFEVTHSAAPVAGNR